MTAIRAATVILSEVEGIKVVILSEVEGIKVVILSEVEGSVKN